MVVEAYLSEVYLTEIYLAEVNMMGRMSEVDYGSSEEEQLGLYVDNLCC